MVCRRRHGIERFFDQREAARKLNDYPRNGPRKLTQLLIDAIKEEEVQGQALLDIDGGIGAIQPELLKAGAGSAVGVEASTAYVRATEVAAQRRATQGG